MPQALLAAALRLGLSPATPAGLVGVAHYGTRKSGLHPNSSLPVPRSRTTCIQHTIQIYIYILYHDIEMYVNTFDNHGQK